MMIRRWLEILASRGLPLLAGSVVLIGAAVGVDGAPQLRGSRASMDRQNEAAERNDFSYLASERHIARFVLHGLLVPVVGNQDYRIDRGVSFPYARPVARRFIQDFGAKYRRACGSEMVVTSLARPQNRQPSNASQRSVHPTGMAIDLRVPQDADCRSWMDANLAFYESQEAIEATLERRPPHYHVAVLPDGYREFLAQRGSPLGGMEPRERLALELAARASTGETYRVRPGDNLSTIANRFGTSVSDLRHLNDLLGSAIEAGQVIQVPKGERD